MYLRFRAFWAGAPQTLVLTKLLSCFPASDRRLGYELVETETAKLKRTMDQSKMINLMESGDFSAVVAYNRDREEEGLAIEVKGRQGCVLPYYFDFRSQLTEGMKQLELELLDRLIRAADNQYGFLICSDDWLEAAEEASFNRSQLWTGGPPESDPERDRYVFTLQQIREDIGLIIPQFYLINYFSDEILENVRGIIEEYIDEQDWEITRLGERHTRIAFRDLNDLGRFKQVQADLRERLWSRPEMQKCIFRGDEEGDDEGDYEVN